jgi:hypothetical protein
MEGQSVDPNGVRADMGPNPSTTRCEPGTSPFSLGFNFLNCTRRGSHVRREPFIKIWDVSLPLEGRPLGIFL